MIAGVQPFISTPAGSLDKKGRVCIPAPYRQILAAQNATGVYGLPSFCEQALECFGEDVLQSFQAEIAKGDPFFTPKQDDKAFAVLAMSQLLALDETGRVRLPDSFIAHAGLKENVTFVGLGRKFQIWDKERFDSILQERLARARVLRDAPAAGDA
jgi:MraZ protein